MTFYWWSHWFWITLLCNILFPLTIVHTYPSQEISLEYNQNSKAPKTVTKLYQTTTTLTWATSAAPPNYISMLGIAADKTILQSVTPEIDRLYEQNNEDEEDDVDVDVDDEVNDDLEHEAEETIDNLAVDEIEEFEFKRSAENYNKTNNRNKQTVMSSGSDSNPAGQTTTEDKEVDLDDGGKLEAPSAAGVEAKLGKLKRDNTEATNYTNFTSTANALKLNLTNENNSKPQGLAEISSESSIISAAAAPSAPRIDNPHAAMEWFNAMARGLPSSHISTVSSGDDSESVDAPAEERKVPFTLENVNKEEELRRAENEHRSRKSKELSAEYKHINRFINYSSDSKSLLTRSASAAPNEFDEGGDSNISEALAIQRTYFLDASAISAICFTVFGVCCTVGTLGIVLYRRRFLNKPQALSEPDSSVYIDDSTMRVSDNSDEMYSLDNDSFLNSLEAMTIQNYWTDTVKHTKL